MSDTDTETARRVLAALDANPVMLRKVTRLELRCRSCEDIIARVVEFRPELLILVHTPPDPDMTPPGTPNASAALEAIHAAGVHGVDAGRQLHAATHPGGTKHGIRQGPTQFLLLAWPPDPDWRDRAAFVTTCPCRVRRVPLATVFDALTARRKSVVLGDVVGE